MSKLRDKYDALYVRFALWFAAMQHVREFSVLAKQSDKVEGFNKQFKKVVVPYWKQYGVKPKKNWYRVYWAANKMIDPRFIPNDLWLTDILPSFNSVLYSKGALQDKCMHNLYLPGIKRPDTVIKNIAGTFYDDELNFISQDDAIARCRACDEFIVKPSVGTSQGHGIKFYSGTEMTEEDVMDVFRHYERNFIIQPILKQHKIMSMLNDTSLNTVRMISFFYKGEVHILSAILRVGGKKQRLDNVSKGGYQCTIKPDGTLEPLAYAYRNGVAKLTNCTEDGIVFGDITVPGCARIREIINYYAPRMGHFKLLGWDFAINEDGEPVMIEYNTLPGQNQMTCGPTFGNLTEEVLNTVYKTE